MDCRKDTPREVLLEIGKDRPDIDALSKLDDCSPPALMGQIEVIS